MPLAPTLVVALVAPLLAPVLAPPAPADAPVVDAASAAAAARSPRTIDRAAALPELTPPPASPRATAPAAAPTAPVVQAVPLASAVEGPTRAPSMVEPRSPIAYPSDLLLRRGRTLVTFGILAGVVSLGLRGAGIAETSRAANDPEPPCEGFCLGVDGAYAEGWPYRAGAALSGVAMWGLLGGGGRATGRYRAQEESGTGRPSSLDGQREVVLGGSLIGAGLGLTTLSFLSGFYFPGYGAEGQRNEAIIYMAVNDTLHVAGSTMVAVGAYKLGRARGLTTERADLRVQRARRASLRVAPAPALGGGTVNLSGRF